MTLRQWAQCWRFEQKAYLDLEIQAEKHYITIIYLETLRRNSWISDIRA